MFAVVELEKVGTRLDVDDAAVLRRTTSVFRDLIETDAVSAPYVRGMLSAALQHGRMSHRMLRMVQPGSEERLHACALLRGKRVIGCALFSYAAFTEPTALTLRLLCVRRRYRSRGLGRTLLNDGTTSALAWARSRLEAHIDRVLLIPVPAARSFYLRNGYEPLPSGTTLVKRLTRPCLNLDHCLSEKG